MRVLVADRFEAIGVQGLQALGCEVIVDPHLSGESLREALKSHRPEVLVVRSTEVTAEMIQATRTLELVVRAGAGVNTIDVDRKAVPVGSEGDIRYPDLAKKITEEWNQNGSHRGDLKDDKKTDQAILHTDNSTPFSDVVAVIDAIYTPKRDCSVCEKGKTIKTPGFNVTFSVN